MARSCIRPVRCCRTALGRLSQRSNCGINRRRPFCRVHRPGGSPLPHLPHPPRCGNAQPGNKLPVVLLDLPNSGSNLSFGRPATRAARIDAPQLVSRAITEAQGLSEAEFSSGIPRTLNAKGKSISDGRACPLQEAQTEPSRTSRYKAEVNPWPDHNTGPERIRSDRLQLRDCRQAGLRQASFFRSFPVTLLQPEVRLIGRLSESDWSTSLRACSKWASAAPRLS